MAVEVGFLTLEVDKVVLVLKNLPQKELLIRADIEIVNGMDVFRFSTNNEPKFSSPSLKPHLQEEGNENGTLFILGFEGLFLKTNFIELNSEVLNGLSNAAISLKIMSIMSNTEPLVVAKPSKGQPPVALTPSEEILIEFKIPMCIILQQTDSSLLITETVDAFISSDVEVFLHPNVDAQSSFVFNISADNNLAEYVLGAKFLQWNGASMRNAPISWGLHYIDVVDPKAKVQPNASELRSKYIDNICKSVESQSKISVFNLIVGSTESNDSDLSDNVNTIQQLLPSAVVSGGKVSFDRELADQVSIDDDIRMRSDLWTYNWGSSAVSFLHRSDLRRLLTLLKIEPEGAYLPVTVRKSPTPEGQSVEGGELFATGLVDFSSLFKPAVRNVEVKVTLQGSDFSEELPTVFLLQLSSSSPLIPKSTLELLSQKSNKAKESISGAIPHQQVSSITTNSDALGQLRDEIRNTVERVAQEYLSLYPFASANISNNENETEENAAAVSTQLKNYETRKVEFLNYLSTNGIFHELKDNLKVSVQQIIRDRYSAREMALGQSIDEISDHETKVDAILSDLFVFLVRECNIILNSLFSDTLIDRQSAELEVSADVNDEEETVAQHLRRISAQADDCAMDGRFETAETLHLECIQYVDSVPSLSSDANIIHNVYSRYGDFLLRSASSVANKIDEAILKRAREALCVAVAADTSAWRVGLLYVGVLLECGQQELGENALHQVLAAQLNDEKAHRQPYQLTAFDEFDGYDSDQLCPVDPRCYCVLASIFSLQRHELRCRKALRLAVRSFDESDCKPPISSHGSPRRTVVLALTQTAHFLFEFSLCQLGAECVRLALSAEKAATEKMLDKGKPSTTVPHIKHMLKMVQATNLLMNGRSDSVLNSSENTAEMLALESELVATAVQDKIRAWLCAAKIQLSYVGNLDTTKVVDYYLNALECLDSLSVDVQKNGVFIPLSDFIQMAKLLIAIGRYNEALSTLLKGCALFSSASLFLLLGVCFLRLDQTEEAEEAFVAANVLDNRNPDIWAYLCLLSLTFGRSRLDEAEKCLTQALRLGICNVSLLRELTASYISIDKLQIAEDLVRRALGQEGKEYHSTGRRQSSHTRRLLGDVLAGQNQAVQAIEVYQAVIASDDGDAKDKMHKLDAAEKCAALLSSIGRDEELRTLRNIIVTLRE